jgi:hypothetical protein
MGTRATGWRRKPGRNASALVLGRGGQRPAPAHTRQLRSALPHRHGWPIASINVSNAAAIALHVAAVRRPRAHLSVATPRATDQSFQLQTVGRQQRHSPPRADSLASRDYASSCGQPGRIAADPGSSQPHSKRAHSRAGRNSAHRNSVGRRRRQRCQGPGVYRRQRQLRRRFRVGLSRPARRRSQTQHDGQCQQCAA